MNFYVMTLFPEMVMGGLNISIIKRAMENDLIRIEAVNIRDYTLDKHKKVDDYPFGGGAGMLMQAQPVWSCYQSILSSISTEDTVNPDEKNALDSTQTEPVNASGKEKQPRILYMSPQGKTFNQEMARELSKEEDLIFLCGHYEGIDQRVLDRIDVEEVSIGDYVLTGGEFPAMVMIDTISRLVPGVLNNDTSADEESFSDSNLLEYPQYTRPEEWEGMKVPEVLLSGHHKNIEKWRLEKAIENTKLKRPDLYEKYKGL